MTKFKLFFLVILVLFLIVSPLGMFVYYFKAYPISTDIDDWGAFGSYIGGAIGVLLGLFNLLVFVFVTFYLTKIDKRISLNNIRSNTYQNLIFKVQRCLDKLDTPITATSNHQDIKDNIVNFKGTLTTFNKRLIYLFKNKKLNLDCKELINDLVELENSLKIFFDNNLEEVETDIKNQVSSIIVKTDKFLGEIQDYIVNEL